MFDDMSPLTLVILLNGGALLLWMFLMWFQSRLWTRVRYRDDDR
jgi:hypothetical protein